MTDALETAGQALPQEGRSLSDPDLLNRLSGAIARGYFLGGELESLDRASLNRLGQLTLERRAGIPSRLGENLSEVTRLLKSITVEFAIRIDEGLGSLGQAMDGCRDGAAQINVSLGSLGQALDDCRDRSGKILGELAEIESALNSLSLG